MKRDKRYSLRRVIRLEDASARFESESRAVQDGLERFESCSPSARAMRKHGLEKSIQAHRLAERARTTAIRLWREERVR